MHSFADVCIKSYVPHLWRQQFFVHLKNDRILSRVGKLLLFTTHLSDLYAYFKNLISKLENHFIIMFVNKYRYYISKKPKKLLTKLKDTIYFISFHMVVRPIRWNKTQFFASSGCVHTNIWMHHLDTDYGYIEKAWCQLHIDATSYIVQILEVTSHKTAAVRQPITHLEDYPN